MNIADLTVNIRVTVNHQNVALWRVRWAYRLARWFGIPIEVETESAR